MSVRVMADVWDHSLSTGASRLVLLALADSAHDSGELSAYARSQSYLAQKARLSRRSVQRALDELITLGEIEVVKQGDGRASSDYRVTLRPRIEGRQDDAPGAPESPPRGVTVTPLGRQDGAPIIPSSPASPPSPPRAVPARIDPERCSVEDAAGVWPRPGTKPHRLRKQWRTAVEKAGGTADMAIAVSALVTAWAGATEQELKFCPSLERWLADERYREGVEQQGPRRDDPPPGAARNNGPTHPSEVPLYDVGGRRHTDDEVAALTVAAEEAWLAHYGTPAW